MSQQHGTALQTASARHDPERGVGAFTVPMAAPVGRPSQLFNSISCISAHKSGSLSLLPPTVVEGPHGVFFRKDRRGRYIYGDARFCSSVGRTLKELLGKTDFDVFPKQTAERHCALDRRVLETGEVLDATEDLWLPSGGVCRVQVIKAPILDSEGTIVGVQGMLLDVAAGRRAEAELKRRTSTLAAVLAQMTAPQGERKPFPLSNPESTGAETGAPTGTVANPGSNGADQAKKVLLQGDAAALPHRLPQNHYFHKDREGRFIFANDQFCASLGRALAEVVGKTDWDFYPPALAEKYCNDDRLIMQAGRVLEMIEEHRLPTGERLFVQVIKAPLYDANRNIIGVQGAFWDITAKHFAESELCRQSRVLRSIVETLGEGVIVVDEFGQPIVASPTARRLLNTDVHTPWSWPALAGPETESPLARALRGEGVIDCEMPIRSQANPEVEWLNVATRPIVDDLGQIRGAVAVLRDITDKKREELRRNAEHAVTRVLAESTSTTQAAGRLLRAIGESLGWAIGAMWTIDGWAGALRCVDVWRGRELFPTFEAVTRQMAVLPGIGLPGRVWTSGKPQWIEDVTRDVNFPRAGIAAHDGLHAAFAFPIRGANGVLGVVEFFSPVIQQPNENVLQMVEAIGLQIGQFIERRRAEKALHRREQELSVARDIQQGLLPRAVPTPAGLSIAGGCRAAMETGGDYYDFLTWSDGSLGIAIGDAIHHGIGAAMLMAHTRAYLRALALTHTDVSQILALTNRRLVEDVGEDRFVSLFLGKIDPQSRTLSYSSAGHPTGYVLDKNGDLKALLKSTGTLVGLSSDNQFPTAQPVTMEGGDLLLLLTDGILEAQSPDDEEFGIGRTLALIRQRLHEAPASIVEALLQEVRLFTCSRPHDDMTAVVVKAA